MKLKKGMLVEYYGDRGYRIERIIRIEGNTITVASTLYDRPFVHEPGKCPRKKCPLIDRTHRHRHKGGRTRIEKSQIRRYFWYGKWRKMED